MIRHERQESPIADQLALKRAFGEYARTIARPYDVGEVLYRLTDHVTDILGVDGAGVSMAEADGQLKFVMATEGAVNGVERLQIKAGQGPGHDASLRGAQVTTADLRAEERWPRYVPGVVDLGMRAVCSLPMIVGELAIGVLNVYHREPREWPADDMADAQLLADTATGYIINAFTLRRGEQLAANLTHALESRVVIEQAKGVVAERHHIATDVAFERLRTHARSHRLRIHDAARDVVSGAIDV